MVTNADGWIAILYLKSLNFPVNIRGAMYQFQKRSYYSIAWVNPEHVPDILLITRHCNCGGGHERALFRYATQQEVNIWEGRKA